MCAFLTAIYTGMRTGEVLALTWNDINFDEDFINVEHSVYDQPKDSLGRWYYGPTKTGNGERDRQGAGKRMCWCFFWPQICSGSR